LEGFTVLDHGFFFNEKQILLAPIEEKVLHCLWERKGRVVSKDGLLDYCYNQWPEEPKQDIFNVFITRIRRAIKDAGAPPLIETVWGRGFTIVANPRPPQKR